MKLRHKKMARACFRGSHGRFAKWWSGQYTPSATFEGFRWAARWERQFRSIR